MRSDRLLCCRVVAVLIAISAASATCSQVVPPPTAQARAIEAEEIRLYSDAQPYLEDSLPDLERKVPELEGINSDSDQDLSALLLKVGATVDELVRKVPDLTSDERVTKVQWAGIESCAFRTGCSGSKNSQTEKNFRYILLPHVVQNGRILQEYRTQENNEPVEEGPEAPNFQGFVASWVVFSPSNREESRFRYLGEQHVGKRDAFVVAFAQTPGSVQVPGALTNEGRTIPILFQGIAWIDSVDFRILQIRTDILAPQLQIGLQKQTARIYFGPVDISQLSLKLWLPMSVDVSIETNGLIFEEKHVYSKYRMYHATSRILP